MPHPKLIEHKALQPLMPHIQSAGAKGMSAFLANRTSFAGTAEEIYAGAVANRISALDNSLTSLRMVLSYIMDLATGSEPSPEEYRYHYENFVLRAVGLIDRSHRLVGASLLLNQTKYESSSGNRYVASQAKLSHPEICIALLELNDRLKAHKAVRNQIIHSSAFSDKELGMFSAFESLGLKPPPGIDLHRLMREHISLNAAEVASLICDAERLLLELIESMSSLYAVLRVDA